MEKNNPLDVDQQTPGSVSYMAETRDGILLQHGGSVSRIHFETATVMDMETFLATEVPKLSKTGKTKGELYVLRDIENKNITLLYGDCVLKYDVDYVEEVKLDILSKYLQTSEMKTFFPGIHYPLVGYVEKTGRKEITVQIDPHQITFRTEKFKGGLFEDKITLPPIWFRTSINNANAIMGAGIAVVLQRELDPLNTKLYHWVLPNVHGSGEVCLGSTRIEVHGLDTVTEGVCIQMALDQIFNSLWNMDLTWDYDYKVVLGDAYNKLPKLNDYEKRIADNSGDATMCHMIRLLRVLKEPSGYLMINWPEARFSADTFLRRL